MRRQMNRASTETGPKGFETAGAALSAACIGFSIGRRARHRGRPWSPFAQTPMGDHRGFCLRGRQVTIETEDLRVATQRTLPSPMEVKSRHPASDELLRGVVGARRQVKAILERRDHRLLVVVGPCSIHDPRAALDYAERLSRLSDETKDTLCIVMRAYFEKPRTDARLEGPDQRSVSRRHLPCRGRNLPCPQTAARYRSPGATDRNRSARSDDPSIPAGSHHLVCHRRTYGRIPNAPGNGIGTIIGSRSEERHRRVDRCGGQCAQSRLETASIPWHRRPRTGRADPNPGQPQRPYRAAWRATAAPTTTPARSSTVRPDC